MASISFISDPFNSNVINSSLWTNTSFGGGAVTESGGNLVCTPLALNSSNAGEIDSVSTYNLTGSQAFIRVDQVASQNPFTTVDLVLDGSNKLSMFQQAGVLTAQQTVATVVTSSTITYDAIAHKWWRIRESGGTTFWDYSADGKTWINLRNVANPITLTALTIKIYVFEGSSDAAPSAAKFSNFNVQFNDGKYNLARYGVVADGVSRSEAWT